MRFCLEIVLQTTVVGGLALGLLNAAGIQQDLPALPRATWVVKVDTRTGKLVRTLVAAKPTPADDAAVRSLVADAAKTFDVSPLLVDSVIQVESNYNPFAVSPKGAQGLMQLMPATAQRFGVTNSFDPRQNIEAGVRYLKFLQDTFQDDRLAIAAYNAGEKAVVKYKTVPPYAETVSYVAKVGKKYGQAKKAAAKAAESVEDKALKDNKTAQSSAEQTEPATKHILAFVDAQGKLHLATQ